MNFTPIPINVTSSLANIFSSTPLIYLAIITPRLVQINSTLLVDLP